MNLIAKCSQINLLTNQVGAVQTKKTFPTVVTTKILADGVGTDQQKEYDTNVGPSLLMTDHDGDTSRVQKGMFP